MEGSVKIIATDMLRCITMEQVPGLEKEQFDALKYGSGDAEVCQSAADWLIEFGHAVKKEGE